MQKNRNFSLKTKIVRFNNHECVRTFQETYQYNSKKILTLAVRPIWFAILQIYLFLNQKLP